MMLNKGATTRQYHVRSAKRTNKIIKTAWSAKKPKKSKRTKKK